MDNAPQMVQDRNAPPATLVIFGASGDLTRRKLIPAVESLARHNRLTGHFAVVGVARTHMDDDTFLLYSFVCCKIEWTNLSIRKIQASSSQPYH